MNYLLLLFCLLMPYTETEKALPAFQVGGVREITAMVQQSKDSLHTNFIGRWVNSKTQRGYQISANGLVMLTYYRNRWQESNLLWDKVEFSYAATSNSSRFYEGWGIKQVTFREYLTDGTENTFEVPSYAVYKLSLLNPETLEVRISRDYSYNENIGPASLSTNSGTKKEYPNDTDFSEPQTFQRLPN